MPGKRQSAASSRRSALRVLLLGDVVGKIGRRAVAQVLPRLQRRYRPSLVIANAENLAHGLGVTEGSLNEMRALGIGCFTSGNHIWSKEGLRLVASEPDLLRPANYPASAPGTGARVITAGPYRLLVVNLQGRVFMNQQIDDPFRGFDAILAQHARARLHAVIVDFHAEATSEKAAFAWYVDGRATLVAGTHTHVQTADEGILPKGTGLLTDLGMCGARDSVIGTDPATVVQHQMSQMPLKHIIPDDGPAIVCGLVVEINPATRLPRSLTRIAETVTVPKGQVLPPKKEVKP